MGFLAGGKSKTTQPVAVSGLQIQSSTYGAPVPLIYGATRSAPNLIWYGDFVATQQASSGGSAGKGGVGGGGGGKGGSSGNYTYQTAVCLGLCEGPITGVGEVFVDKNITTPAALGMSVFPGTYPQSPWGYLSAKYGPATESYTIPRAAPYTVTVRNAASFLTDDGVTGPTASVQYAGVAGGPGFNQYSVSGAGLYTFNAANAGSLLVIQYHDRHGQAHKITPTIPAASPFTVNVNLYTPGSEGYFDTQSVTGTNPGYTKVGGAPAVNQYAEAGGIYTFNAANAGLVVNICYLSADQAVPFQALGYNGIAYLAASAYQLGNSAQLPNHNFEVLGKFYATAPYGAGDADPSLVIADLLTNPKTGAGLPPSRLGDLGAYQAYTLASSLWVSPSYNQQAAASSILDDLATATNSAFVWSSGVLTLVPYGDQAITANGYTYTPPSSPLYSLTDDDFQPNTYATGASGSTNPDPVLLTRQRPSDALNSIKLECLDRANSYNPAIVESKDQALIEMFGLRAGSASQSHMFCDLNAGMLSAQLQLQRQAIRNIYQFALDQRYVLLDPMDIVALTDSSLGLDEQWVRITEITENDDGTLSFVAEEYLDGTGNAPLHTFQAGSGFQADYNSAPGNANAPIIFEPTAELSESLEVYLAASGPANWGGCDAWISYDGQSYKQAGRITGPSRTGVLAAPLPIVATAATGQTIDPASTLAVDLTESRGQLLSTSQADANSLNTLCYVDGEYVAYQDATLTAVDSYDLTYLIRGCYGTTIGAHQVGSRFVRMDGGILTYPYTQDYIGKTIYIKLTSFNIYGGGEQALSDVQPYNYTLQGTAFTSPPPDVTNLRTSYVAAITQIAWDEVADFRAVLYEVRKGSSWAGGQVLGRVAHPPINAQGDGTYWVAAYSQPLPGLQAYSREPQEIAILGSQITQNVIASYDEYATGWAGTLGGTAGVVFSDRSGNVLTIADYLDIPDILNYVGSGYVRTEGVGNVLMIVDYLGTLDILNYGGEGNGTYEIPAAHRIDIGRVLPCNVLITWQSIGQNAYDNILAAVDYLDYPDVLDFAASANVTVYPEIALSQDGSTWGSWQKYSAGAYSARKFKARMQLQTSDPNTEAILQSFAFAVDVPDRDDHYIGLALPAGGLALAYTPDGSATPAPFNGGPAGSPSTPAVQVTILAAQQGDTINLTNSTLSGCTLQVLNGGVGAARSVNVLAQGY